MHTLEPLGGDRMQFLRLAARHRLDFYVQGNYLYSLRGWKGEPRKATAEELQMWDRLVGPMDTTLLPATTQEILDSLEREGRGVDITLHYTDFCTLRRSNPQGFELATQRDILMLGVYGWYWGSTLNVSSKVKPGFYYPGSRIKSLWEASGSFLSGEAEEGERKLLSGLKPFRVNIP